MTLIQRLMMRHRLMNAAGEHGSDSSGSGTGGDGSGAGDEGAGKGAGEGEGEGEGGKGAGSEGGEGEGGEKGKAKPSDAEARLLKEVMTKKTALETATNELTQVKAKLKEFEGLDISKARALLADAEEAERKRAEAAGDYEKLKTQMAASHSAEKTALQAQLDAAASAATTLQKQIAELTVGGAFSGSSFIPELTLPASKARALYGSHFEFKDGVVVGYDKPASAADRAPLVDAAGNALSFDAALKKIVDADPDHEALYRSKQKPGAGSSTQKAPKRDQQERDTTLTGTDRIAQGLKNLAKQTGGK